MRYLTTSIFILLTFFCITLQAQENSVLTNLQNEKLNEFPINQRLFLHINKTKYKDTDTIWFKGYSMQGPLQQPSNISQTMIVALLNSEKEVVESSQFLIFDGTAEGQIVLTKMLGGGQFELVAYASNMLNQDLNYIFRTPIEIVPTKQKKYNFSYGFNRPFYHTNEQVEMQVLTYDQYYKPHKKIEIIYDILDGDKKLDGGKIRSNDQGVAYLNFAYKASNSNKLPLKINVQAGSFESPFTGTTYASSAIRAIDVQLLPEGGDLVAGLMNIVAFRCVDDQGQPVEISGDVVNSKGEVVTGFNTSHQGMGKFMMIPQVGEIYKLQVKSPVIYSREFEFPKVLDKGFTISYLGSRGDNTIFKLSKNFEGTEKVTAVWQMDGFVLGTQTIMLENDKMFSFSKKDLPTGIAKLTLFDKGGEPFAERLVFVRSKNNLKVNINLNHNKFLARSKGNIDLEILSADSLPVDASLSVTVTHIAEGINPLLPIPDIRDYTIFNSELSGQVFQPSQYFDESVDKKLNEYRSDLLMLTHGWRKYDWYFDLCHKLESGYEYYNYDLYRGVVTKGKNVVPHAPVDVLCFGKGISMSESKADENGRFWVKPEFSEKASPTLIISAEKKNDFSRVKLAMEDREMEMRDSVAQLFYKELMPYVYRYNADVYNEKEKIDTLFRLWDTKYIEEVMVLATKTGDRLRERIKRYSTGSTRALTQDDFGGTITDMESMIEQLGAGLYVEDDQVVKTAAGDQVSIPIVLNELELRDATFSEISYLSSDMLEGIAFVKGGILAAELDSGGQNGALMIWTKKGKNVQVSDKEAKNKYTSNRYGRVYKYYSPKYENPEQIHNPIPDNRITVLWNNSLKTDSLGKTSVQFYNGDIKGKYKINIQGVSAKEGLVFKEVEFVVQ